MAYLAPAAGPATVTMLHQQVGSADLTLERTLGSSRAAAVAVVRGHVVLELVGVGVCGRLPAGDLVDGVEVVGEVLGVGMAHLPVGREAGIGLEMGQDLGQPRRPSGRLLGSEVCSAAVDAGQGDRGKRSELLGRMGFTYHSNHVVEDDQRCKPKLCSKRRRRRTMAVDSATMQQKRQDGGRALGFSRRRITAFTGS